MQSCNDFIRNRIRLIAVFLVLGFIGVAVRLYFVQVRRHDHYLAEARKKYVSEKTTTGNRGEIFDVLGNLLVGNMPCQDVTVTPCNVPAVHDEVFAQLIANSLQLDYSEIYKKIALKSRERRKADGTTEMRPNQYALLARNVPLETARKLQRELLDLQIRLNKTSDSKINNAFHFTDTTVRYYPKGQLLSNVLGFTKMDQDNVIALMGVERFFDRELRDVNGQKVIEHDIGGRPLGDPLAETPSRDGLNVYLTIQEPIQAILEEELEKAVEQWHPRAAYAVMADPKTGSILAMAQRPSFDPNNRVGIQGDEWRIRIMEDVFEPGSVMKAVTVAGALDYGVVTPSTRIDCGKGFWVYHGKTLTDTHAYGMQDVTGVIRKSSNIGTAQIALMLGEKRLNRTLRKFGFGSRTGLPLKPETRGILPTLDKWDGLSITRFGMGYGVAVSPVQMVRAYCALATRGKLPKLRLVDRVENPVTKEVTYNPIEPPVQVFNSNHAGEEIVKMMITVTETGGTALKAAIPGYHVAGKTGTARKVEHGHYVAKYFGTFIGFVPAENPAFVLLVTMDEPHGSYYGGTVSGPAWRAIAERTLKYLDIKPNVPVPEKKK